MLLHLHPEHAIINGINAELINLYQVVWDDCEAMIREAASMKNDKEQYYRIRNPDSEPGYQRLARSGRSMEKDYLRILPVLVLRSGDAVFDFISAWTCMRMRSCTSYGSYVIDDVHERGYDRI